MEKKITSIMIGAGRRGTNIYAAYALENPSKMEFVAVAEPNDLHRKKFGDLHHIPEEHRFKSWEELLSKPRIADAAFICTMDRLHYQPYSVAVEKGYHILVEKPMSTDIKECINMARLSKSNNDKVIMVCHVLRYSQFFQTIKKMIDSNRIGKIIGIQLNENVGIFLAVTGYVRGPWRNSDETSSMLLAKSCHDLDILSWLAGSESKKVSSFGSLQFFKKENAPENSGLRCMECAVERECPYSGMKLYDDMLKNMFISDFPQKQNDKKAFGDYISNAYWEGAFGKCVFRCDNNVVDHQVVNIEFNNGIIADFVMSSFTDDTTGRSIKVFGTRGEIVGSLGKNRIRVTDFLTGNVEQVTVKVGKGEHGGGDVGLMDHFTNCIRNQRLNGVLSTPHASLDSHLIAFASEKARNEDKVILMDELRNSYCEEV